MASSSTHDPSLGDIHGQLRDLLLLFHFYGRSAYEMQKNHRYKGIHHVLFECCESTSRGCCVFYIYIYIGIPVTLVFEKANRTKGHSTFLLKRPDDDEDEDAEKDSQGLSAGSFIHFLHSVNIHAF